MSDVQINHGPVEAVADAPSAADASRDALLAELCGLGATMSAAMEAVPGFVPCGHAFGVVVEGLYAASACGDAAQLDELAADVRARSEHVSAHRGVAQGAVALAAPQSPETALLLAACLLYTSHAPVVTAIIWFGINRNTVVPDLGFRNKKFEPVSPLIWGLS